jgi:hypothetical protein
MKVLWAYLLVSVAVWAHLFVRNLGGRPGIFPNPHMFAQDFPEEELRGLGYS